MLKLVAKWTLYFLMMNNGMNVKARKYLLGKTHVKSVKATALLPRNYNANARKDVAL